MSTEIIGFPDKQPSDIENGGKIKVSVLRITGFVFLVFLILVSTFMLNHFSSEDDVPSEKNSSLGINNGLLGNILVNQNEGDVINGRWCTKYNESFLTLAVSLNLEGTNVEGTSICLTYSNEDSTSSENLLTNQEDIVSLYLVNMDLSRIENDIFRGLINLNTLYLDNNTLEFIHLEHLQAMPALQYLSMKNNELTMYNQAFPLLPSLSELYLDNNSITIITEYTFMNLYNVHVLSLSHNGIKTIAEEAFQNLSELRELNICHNKIVRLNPAIFINQDRLKRLCLGNNPVVFIPNDCFKNLVDLEYLNLEDVRIENINTAMFQSLHNLESVDFISHYYCQYVPNQHNCRPNGDGISSSTNILSKPMFRYWNWIISSVICIGNFLVIFSRLLCKDDNPMLSLVIRNLAVSDFLMGVYLVIIGIKDVKYRNRYNEVVQEWKASWECTITGIVGMLSSEVTVCILVFISVDRFLMITSPLGKRSLQNKRHTMTILCIIWFLGILIAVAPVFRYANDDDRFYGVTGLCFPLHIGNTYFTGWQYSAVIIFGINATSLIIIAVVYVTMFVSIWKTRNATPLPRKEYDFVVRFFFIVFIYTICWLPIIILKATVFFSEISDEFYGWLIVFVLPINSASNPVLYTFTSPRFTARIRKSFAVENIVAKNNEYTSPAVSTEVKDDLEYGKNDANQVKIVVNKF